MKWKWNGKKSISSHSRYEVPPGGDAPGERSIMRYTEYGLEIELEELRRMLDYAENRAQYYNMERCLYIKGGTRPTVTQYCCYAECSPINHTYRAK